MPDTSTIVAFSVAALVLFVVPGPAVLYIITRSVVGGRRAGLVSVAGIHLGSLVHIAAAIAGLSAILATSAVSFRVVKWAGALYLIYLGVRAILDRGASPEEPAGLDPAPMDRVFWQGFVVNALNPKTAVFFLAFVPHFVDPAGDTTAQLLTLGALFVALGGLSDGLYAMAFGALGRRLTTATWWRTARWAVPGSVYLGLGAFAVLAGGEPDG